MMKKTMRPAWVEIDRGALENNINIVKSRVMPGSRICGIVKANAYGHGLREVVKLMIKCGIDCFAVASIGEALQVRTLAPFARIIMLGMIDRENFDLVLEEDITAGICDAGFARELSAYAFDFGKRADVLAFVDTGMGRIGFQWDEPDLKDELKEISELPGLNFIGLMSHFSSSDENTPEGKAYTDLQQERFESLRQELISMGIKLPLCTLANSFPTMYRKSAHYQLCRPGIVIYGGYSYEEFRRDGILPTFAVKAKVMFVKDVPAGYYVSYGRKGRTERPSRIATLPIGYADGLPRAWGRGRGYVLFGGRKAPIIGNICMDQLMVDITDLPDVAAGSEAVLAGMSRGVYLDPAEIGESCGELEHGIMCGMSVRLPYVYR